MKNPKTFNEKLNWLKLNVHDPKQTDMVDKLKVKEIIKEELGEEYVVPLLGVWKNPEDIDFDQLPEKFVLKCNHNSNGLLICRDKSKIDRKEVVKAFKKSIRKNGYEYSREWPYKNVEPCVFAEEYLEDSTSKNLTVYKFFTFDGQPKIIQVIQDDKTDSETIDYFDCEWKLLPLKQNFPNSKIPQEKPKKLTEMLEVAKKLSKGFPFLRVDLYEVSGKIYFSEFTFYSDTGMAKFEPEEWDNTLGDWINLEKVMDRKT